MTDINGGKAMADLPGADVPVEFLKQWNCLSVDGRRAFQSYINMGIADAGTVEVNANASNDNSLNLKWKKQGPFALLPPEAANTVWRANKGKRDEQLEAVLEGMEVIRSQKLPRGMILNEGTTQSPVTAKQVVEGCDKMATVLGKGNSAGEITVFKDRKSGQDQALKTVIVSQFNPNEIRLWVQLGDDGKAPELYHFELVDKKVAFTMEVMTGKDLQDTIDSDMWMFPDTELARGFSLCILHDLLQIWETMRGKNFVHGDMHAGNLRLETSMNVKIFDFGRAKNLLTADQPQRLIKSDIVGIIRIFCALYSGYDFNDVFEAVKVLSAQNLKELDDSMIRISEENRKELYHIMTMLFDTVRDSNSEAYGDTSGVVSHVKSLIFDDMTEIKKKAAVIIFPERFQNKAESEPSFKAEGMAMDSVDSMEDLDPIWDHPDMQQFVNNVSDDDLRNLALW